MAMLGWTSTVLVLFVLSVMHSTTATGGSGDCIGSSGDSLFSNCKDNNSSCDPSKHDCHANAVCMIEGGNATCVCNPGFNGTGRISTGGCSASSDSDSGHAAPAVFASFGRLVFMAMMAALIFV